MTPQELKESLLWDALQGKLTNQYANEQAKSELAGVSLKSINEDEVYFEIPRNWVWCRIGDIFDLVNGKAFKPSDWTTEGIPIVRIQNLNDRNAPYNFCKTNVEEKYYLYGGELLFSWSGTPGTSFGAFVWHGGKAVLNQHIFIVYPKITANIEFLKYALNGELKIFIEKAHGGAGLKHITRKEFDNCYLPIPPFAEQERIVAKIEELLPFIDRYEQAWSRLETFNKRFPEDMKKSILQLAIQGKLVEQRPEEGTAEELYQQIQEEKERLIEAGKLKKEKPLPEISEEEKTFDIPETWKWIRLGSILLKVVDGTHKTPKYTEKGVPFVSVRNMSDGRLNLKNTKFISEEEHRELWKRCNPERNDILLSKVGTTGVPAIVDTDEEFSLFVSVALLKFNTEFLCKEFLIYAILTPDFQRQCKLHTRGVGNKNWVIADIINTVFPLPPLAEQKRIVAKLEELLPLCDKLK